MSKQQQSRQPLEGQIIGRTPAGEVVESMPELNEVAYDPTQMTVDLTKAEKRRCTALMLAIQAYSNIIIKDAEYLRVSLDRERAGGPVIQPATMNAMVEAAMNFDDFLAGKFEEIEEAHAESKQIEPAKEEEKK